MNRYVTFNESIDDDEEYRVTVVSFHPPTQDTFDEPGDGGEIDYSPTVERLLRGQKQEELDFDEFVRRYAEHNGVTEQEGRRRIDHAAMMDVMDMLAADHEDAVMSYGEGRYVH